MTHLILFYFYYRNRHSHAISAFVTVMLMPLTYSIAYGLIGGICVYIVMEGTFWILSLVGIAKPSYDEDEGDDAEAKEVEEEAPAEEA